MNTMREGRHDAVELHPQLTDLGAIEQRTATGIHQMSDRQTGRSPGCPRCRRCRGPGSLPSGSSTSTLIEHHDHRRHEEPGDQPDHNRPGRLDEGAWCGDPDKARDGAVAHLRHVERAEHEKRGNRRADHAGGGGQVRVGEDETEVRPRSAPSVDPPLKPIQPTQRIRIPEKGERHGVTGDGYRPCRCGTCRCAARGPGSPPRPAVAPQRWTMDEPAKSRKFSLGEPAAAPCPVGDRGVDQRDEHRRRRSRSR